MKRKPLLLALFVIVAVMLLNFIESPYLRAGKEILFPAPQDSAMVRAARNYANYCASCHYDNLGWFASREFKYGHSEGDIATSIKTGYPDFGMPSYKNTFTGKEIQDIASFIHQKLDLGAAEKKLAVQENKIIQTEEFKLRLDTVIKGLKVPWGMAFLPDGDILVNEREGKMLRFRNGVKVAEIEGMPNVHATGQAGLLDIRLHPDYEKNGWIYFAYTTPSSTILNGWNTALMRAKLKDNQLLEKQLLFKAIPDTKKGHHVGSKITFDGEGHVFFSVGERGEQNNAQDLTNDCGKIHRLNEDGSIPSDNPFVKDKSKGARASIWSYGHRNPQGLIISPFDGKLYETEHGPKGGDELNLIKPGKNYGWPVITYGINYDGTIITRDTVRVGMEQPLTFYRPSIAPCGTTFVTGDQYKNWKGNILIGSLRFQNLERVVLDGTKVVHKETLLHNIGRMRNVEIGPDGFIYVAVENPGIIFKLVPVEN